MIFKKISIIIILILCLNNNLLIKKNKRNLVIAGSINRNTINKTTTNLNIPTTISSIINNNNKKLNNDDALLNKKKVFDNFDNEKIPSFDHYDDISDELDTIGSIPRTGRIDPDNADDDDENYDDDDTDLIEHHGHYPDKIPEDIIDYKSNEYEDKQLGPMLDTFGIKFDGHDTDGTLPIFLEEPQSTYVVKNRPAVLKCKAAHALQLSFKCSGSSQPPPSAHESHVDPHTGVHLEEVTATISRDLVDEYFGKGPFRCECHAWSSRGGAKSQIATVEVAYIRKQFTISPTSVRVELGGRTELDCEAPNSVPTPKLIWFKNNVQIQPEHPVVITPEGSLHIAQASLQDMANYTCVAENIAGKRTSEPATVTVYVNGGWSSWSPSMECKCPGKASQGQKRLRSCSNPMPLNGGAQCEGPNIQKTSDCISCPAGRWSTWSEWSSCSVDCIQIRRRKCITHTMDDGLMGGSVSFTEGYDKSLCSGKDFQTAECRGGNCHIGKDDSDWPLYVGLTVITFVCLALGAALVRTARRGRHTPPYNMTRAVMQSDYLHDADKKAIHFHSDTGTANYEYPTAAHRPLTGNMAMTRSISEHHYDVPNLASNYTTPIDGLSSKYSYATDTADTSTSTSDSTYDVASEPPTLPMPLRNSCKLSTTRDVITNVGGYLKLYNGQIMMLIPEMAINKNLKHTITLSIIIDESSRIKFTNQTTTYLSPIIYCGPNDIVLNKPIILKIPHCMLDPNLWLITVYYSTSFIQDHNIKWLKLLTIGEETINTPIFIQIDNEYAYIMTEQFGRFVIVGEPKFKQSQSIIIKNDNNLKLIAMKKMRLYIFGQIIPNNIICSLRIYIIDDFPNSKNQCERIEQQLGGTIIGESKTFLFYLNQLDFHISLNCCCTIIDNNEKNLILNSTSSSSHSNEIIYENDWKTINDTNEQIIPYNHILNSTSIIHCEFNLQHNDNKQMKHDENSPTKSSTSSSSSKLEIVYSQNNNYIDSYTFYLPYSTFDIVKQQSSIINNLNINNSNSNSNNLIDNSNKKLTILDRDGSTFIQDKTLTILNSTTSDNNMIDGGSVNSNGGGGKFLTRNLKRLLCSLIDPPRNDGKDWRLLANILNCDRYIAYFATKQSPTEQILNLWDCRIRSKQTDDLILYNSNNNDGNNHINSNNNNINCGNINSKGIIELIKILKEMDRQDIIDVLEQNVGPIWF